MNTDEDMLQAKTLNRTISKHIGLLNEIMIK